MTPTLMPVELGCAIAYASITHMDEFDKQGRPYILHPLWIMREVLHLGDDYGILAVSHDVIEKKIKEEGYNLSAALDEWRREVFSSGDGAYEDPTIVADLTLLTHIKEEKSYAEYIRGIKASPRATKVKIADLRHNSDITRLKGLKDSDIARLKVYNASYCFLTDQNDKLLDLV